MVQKRFTVNNDMARLLGKLQQTFGVDNNAEVLRRAVLLADIASRHAGSDRIVVIKGPDEPPDDAETVLLAG
jgi:hypothetical protein